MNDLVRRFLVPAAILSIFVMAGILVASTILFAQSMFGKWGVWLLVWIYLYAVLVAALWKR